MPIQRFKTIEEMNAADDDLWLPCEDPSLFRRARKLLAEGSKLAALQSPRGVRKYRTLEEAEADREAWEDARIRWIRENRVRKP